MVTRARIGDTALVKSKKQVGLERWVGPKEVNKEQPSYRNLSATATRVLQCTCPGAASRKDCSAIGKLYC
jgi:hypothetical protein